MRITKYKKKQIIFINPNPAYKNVFACSVVAILQFCVLTVSYCIMSLRNLPVVYEMTLNFMNWRYVSNNYDCSVYILDSIYKWSFMYTKTVNM